MISIFTLTTLLLFVVRSLYLLIFYKNHRERLKSIIGFKFLEQFLCNKFELIDINPVDKIIFYTNYEGRLFEIRANGFILHEKKWIARISFKQSIFVTDVITDVKHTFNIYSEPCIFTYFLEFLFKRKINKYVNNFKLIDKIDNERNKIIRSYKLTNIVEK